MELTKLWAENKDAILTTVIVVIVGLFVIKFFDVIFWGGLGIALGVSTMLTWNHFSKKYGGLEGIWKAIVG